MQTKIKIKYQGVEPSLPKRQTNPVKKEALHEGVLYWFTHYRAKHFTVAGAKEYGYKPRDGERAGTSSKDFFRSYTGRKQKRFGHRRPLTYSGESEMLTRIRKITATSRSARWTNSARKFNFRASPNAPDMGKEMTTVSAREERQMARVADRRLGEGLKKIRGERVVKAA